MRIIIDFLPEFLRLAKLTYNVSKETDDDIKVTLMSIYDKSKISDVSDEYISALVKELKFN